MEQDYVFASQMLAYGIDRQRWVCISGHSAYAGSRPDARLSLPIQGGDRRGGRSRRKLVAIAS